MNEPGAAEDAPSELPSEGGERAPAGLTPAQQHAAQALTELAAAARAFAVLDVRQDEDLALLRRALGALDQALDGKDELRFEVRATELLQGSAVVYANPEPEKSLAQRLHREGVRRLTLRAGLDGDEFLLLLEALSLTFTRLEPREDDLVTLLRTARMPHVELERNGRPGPRPAGDLPAGLRDELEFPRPELPTPSSPKWIDLPAEKLDALRGEVAAGRVPQDCLDVAHGLRRALADPQAQITFSALAHVFAEIRDALMQEERLDSLLLYAALLQAMVLEPAPAWDPGRTSALRSLLASMGAKRQVRRLLRSMAREERTAPSAVIAALDQICADPLAAVAAVLPDERQTGVRVAARQVLEHYGARRLPELQERFLAAQGQLASDLLRVMAGLVSDDAVAFVVQQSAHPDEAVQDEALWHLSRMPYSTGVGRALLAAFRQTSRERRTRILDLIVRTRDRRFVDLLARHVEEHAAQLTADEGAGIGRAVGLLGGEAAVARWRGWLKPRTDGSRGFDGPLARQVAALLALAEVPGEAAAEALGEAFDQADDAAQPWVLGALAQRQRDAVKPA